MSHHLLFVSMASYGHVMPTLGVVEQLVRRGHRVTYVAAGRHAEDVAAAGAEVLGYESVLANRNLTTELASGDPVANFGIFLEEGVAMLRAVRDRFAAESPDAVVYDQMSNGIGKMISAELRVRAVQTIPTPVYTDQFWAENNTEDAPRPWREAPAELADRHARMEALLREHGIDVPIGEYLAAATEGLNLVFLPRAFQKDADRLDDRYVFTGPCLGSGESGGEWQPPADGRPVVLISLGTVYNGHPEFFRACVRSFTGSPWHVVISGVDAAELGPLPDNVEVHRWVPHLAVLEHARALVTHGGLGSVLQGFYWATPAVVVPVTPLVDIHRRVVELNVGRMVRPEEIEAGRLREAVDELVADPGIDRDVREMRRQVREAGGASRAAAEIERYLTRDGTGESSVDERERAAAGVPER